MQPKLLKSSQLSEFIPAEWHGVNESGYEPVSDFVLVLPDKAAAKSSGGVELPGDIVDRHTMAAETGILIAIGPESFKWISDRTRPWEGRKPQAGDRIYMKRYSGQVLMGDDGMEYRLMEDGCIGAVKDGNPNPSAEEANKQVREIFRRFREEQSQQVAVMTVRTAPEIKEAQKHG